MSKANFGNGLGNGESCAPWQGRSAVGSRVESCLLYPVPEDCNYELKNVLLNRCAKLNDPYRAFKLLENLHVSKRVFIGATVRSGPKSYFPNDDLRCGVDVSRVSDDEKCGSISQHQSLLRLASEAQVVVIYNVKPGRSYYAVFVEATPETDERESSKSTPAAEYLLPDTSNQVIPKPGYASHQTTPQEHQTRLFLAALHGILDLTPPLGPGRLAFAGVPAHAATVMLTALNEAGYGSTYDEPCFKYSLTARALPQTLREQLLPASDGALDSSSSAAAAAAPGGSASGPVPSSPEGLPYNLDVLRTDADAQLVNELWTYRSPYSLPLIRLIISHYPTACVRLGPARPETWPDTQRVAGSRTDATSRSPAASSGPPPATLPTPQPPDAPPCLPPIEPHNGGQPADALPTASDPKAPVKAEAGANTHSGSASRSGTAFGSGFGSESAAGSEAGSDAVAWILQYPDGALGMAHTLAPHRRRGLMRRCVLQLVRRELLGPLAEGDGQQEPLGDGPSGEPDGGGGGGGPAGGPSAFGIEPEVFTFVVRNNTASASLFESLGFSQSPVTYHWIGVAGQASED